MAKAYLIFKWGATQFNLPVRHRNRCNIMAARKHYSIVLNSLPVILLTIVISLYLVLGTYPEAVAADSGSADPTIDELLDRFASTKSIGVFTKLSIKSNVTRLNKSFGVYHQGERPPILEELKERFDLMVQEMVLLVQNKDPELAKDLYAARLLLWSYLSDPDKYVSF